MPSRRLHEVDGVGDASINQLKLIAAAATRAGARFGPWRTYSHFLLLDGRGTLHFRTLARSAAGRRFEPLGVASALDRDRGRGAFDLGEVVPRQIDIRRAEVLLEPVSFVVPGIGTIHGFCPRSHAIAICAVSRFGRAGRRALDWPSLPPV